MTHERTDEDGGCIMCGFSHRYQWPSGSDASGHDGSYVACINSLVPEVARLRAALEEAEDRHHRTWVAVSNYFAAKGKVIPADICLAATPEESSK